MSYTDVDRLILDRWTEVIALQEAFDGLLTRMTDNLETAIVKAERAALERGWLIDQHPKDPFIDVYKPDWRRKDEAVIYFRVSDFAPHHYGDVEADHPWVWLLTTELDRWKIREPERVQFARELRTALGPSLPHWDHRDCVDASEPIGRYFSDVSDADRVRWMKEPDVLATFLVRAMEEAMAVAPMIDQTLIKFRKV